jgi:serine/threonine protein kinase
MLSPGDLVAGKYQIERQLGAGGMGTVYVAINVVLHKPVAIKVMTSAFAEQSDAVTRFFREAMSASKVRHPAIVEIYDAGSHEGAPWMAMQLLEGESLGQRITRGPLTIPEIGPIFGPVLSALDMVHQHGIVHRDLKPDNIFLERLADGSMQPKLLDFGIAKSSDELGKLTQSGTIMGTAHYLAPEQARDSSTVDPRTDIYAIGVVLYEALSGQMPHHATTLPELITKLISEDPVPLHHVAPHVPPGVAQVVHACLARDRNARPQRAAEVATLLGRAITGMPSQAPMIVTPPPISSPAPLMSPAPMAYGHTHPITMGTPPSAFGAPMHSPAPYVAPLPPPPQASSAWVKWVLLAVGLFVAITSCVVITPFALGIWAVYEGVQNAGGLGGGLGGDGMGRFWMNWRRPFSYDVNGDDRHDVIGWATAVPSSSSMLCAHDGTNGEEIWCADIGEESDASYARTVRVGGHIVHIESNGDVHAFVARTGRALDWEASVRGKPQHMCAMSGRLAVQTEDGVVSMITIATGAIAVSGDMLPQEGCASVASMTPPIGSSREDDAPPGWLAWRRVRFPEEAGLAMDVRRAWRTESMTDLLLIGVARGENRTIPKLALTRNEAVVWQADVCSSPLAARTQAPEAVAFTEETVFAVYGQTARGDAPRRLAAFRMSDGTRLWDAPLPRTASGYLGYALTDGHNVYVQVQSALYAFDAQSGEPRFTLGRP